MLFLVLSAAFGLIALAAARSEQWPLALPTLVLGGWLATLAFKGLRPR
jgi:hypothetical protein